MTSLSRTDTARRRPLAELLAGLEHEVRGDAGVEVSGVAYRSDEVEYQLNDSEARVLVVHEEKLPLVEEIRATLKTVRHILVIGASAPPGMHRWDDVVRDHPATRPPEARGRSRRSPAGSRRPSSPCRPTWRPSTRRDACRARRSSGR